VLKFFQNARAERVREISRAMAMLMRDNTDAYRRHLAGTGHEGLIVDAMNVTVFRGGAHPDPADLQYRLREEIGCEISFIGAGELRDLEPALSSDYSSAALIHGQARALDPGRLTKALAEKARALGATFHQTEVTALSPQPDGTIALHNAGDTLRAERMVLAGGIWSADLLKPLGIHLPLMAERGYHLEFSDPGIALHNSIADASAKVIASSMQGGVRIAGTAEFAAADAPPNYARAAALQPLAQRLFPGLRTEKARKWMGARPSFPDNLPAIGRLPGVPNILTAFGHSHYGLGMAPATARLVVEELAGKSNLDLTALNASRFLR
ncbi:MAG: FAD-dependent oxidoreductase, partial [Pseudomonadota bacterium]